MDFVQAVEGRLIAVGFDRLEPPISDSECLMYYRTSHEWTKLGWVVTIVNLVRVVSQPAQRELEDLSVASWSACRTAADRFSSRPDYLLAYTVLFAALSPETKEYLEAYRPKHWKGKEFPVVIDQLTGEPHFNHRSRAWGAAYHEGQVRTANELFGRLRT